MITAINIILFLQRKNMINLLTPEDSRAKKFLWNMELLDLAIAHQEDCSKLPEDDTGAWILCHFAERYHPCLHLIQHPEDLVTYADDVAALWHSMSPKPDQRPRSS